MIVKAITPSILVRFSKFLCLNTTAFQDLSGVRAILTFVKNFLVFFFLHFVYQGFVKDPLEVLDFPEMKRKGLGKLICLGTKILKIGPKLRELWP